MAKIKTTKPKKKGVVISLIKALSEKSANEFNEAIESGKLYAELKPQKNNEKK